MVDNGARPQGPLFDQIFHWYFPRPQLFFGPDTGSPPPPKEFVELVEETTGVFENMIYNETGGGNDGNVIITFS